MAKQWTPEQVLSLGNDFQSASVLTTAAEFDLFSILSGRTMTAPEIAGELETDLRATTVTLDALVALELLDKEAERYSVPPNLAPLLTNDDPFSVLPMLQHHAVMLRRWAQLPQVMKTGEPPEDEHGIRGREAELESFIGAMHVVSAPRATSLASSVMPEKFHHLLDIGGASGSWTIEFLKAMPDAAATIFDLPEVIPMAEKRIKASGLADRVTLTGGDFNTDDLPGDADFAWVGAILHMLSREQIRALLAKVCKALEPGGTIAIADVLLDESRTQPPCAALFAVNMLVATEGGNAYRYEEIRDDLAASGFENVKLVNDGEFMDSVIAAVKPKA